MSVDQLERLLTKGPTDDGWVTVEPAPSYGRGDVSDDDVARWALLDALWNYWDVPQEDNGI